MEVPVTTRVPPTERLPVVVPLVCVVLVVVRFVIVALVVVELPMIALVMLARVATRDAINPLVVVELVEILPVEKRFAAVIPVAEALPSTV